MLDGVYRIVMGSRSIVRSFSTYLDFYNGVRPRSRIKRRDRNFEEDGNRVPDKREVQFDGGSSSNRSTRGNVEEYRMSSFSPHVPRTQDHPYILLFI